jgi:hypothetical protein
MSDIFVTSCTVLNITTCNYYVSKMSITHFSFISRWRSPLVVTWLQYPNKDYSSHFYSSRTSVCPESGWLVIADSHRYIALVRTARKTYLLAITLLLLDLRRQGNQLSHDMTFRFVRVYSCLCVRPLGQCVTKTKHAISSSRNLLFNYSVIWPSHWLLRTSF